MVSPERNQHFRATRLYEVGGIILIFAVETGVALDLLCSRPQHLFLGPWSTWMGRDIFWVIAVGALGFMAHGGGTWLFRRWLLQWKPDVWREYDEAMAGFIDRLKRTYFAKRANRIYGLVFQPLLEEVLSRWLPLLFFDHHPFSGACLVILMWLGWSFNHIGQLTGRVRRMRVVELLIVSSWIYLGVMAATFFATRTWLAPLLAAALAHALHNALYFYSLRYRRFLAGSGVGTAT